MPIDVRRLRLLREVAHRGTIAAAADALSYTPSAVSQQLSTLEKEVGSPLLERTGRGVRLTDEGWMLVRHGDNVFAELERAEAGLEVLDVERSHGQPGADERQADADAGAADGQRAGGPAPGGQLGQVRHCRPVPVGFLVTGHALSILPDEHQFQ